MLDDLSPQQLKTLVMAAYFSGQAPTPDYDKFAAVAGYKTKGSAQVSFSVLKTKLFKGEKAEVGAGAGKKKTGKPRGRKRKASNNDAGTGVKVAESGIKAGGKKRKVPDDDDDAEDEDDIPVRNKKSKPSEQDSDDEDNEDDDPVIPRTRQARKAREQAKKALSRQGLLSPEDDEA